MVPGKVLHADRTTVRAVPIDVSVPCFHINVLVAGPGISWYAAPRGADCRGLLATLSSCLELRVPGFGEEDPQHVLAERAGSPKDNKRERPCTDAGQKEDEVGDGALGAEVGD